MPDSESTAVEWLGASTAPPVAFALPGIVRDDFPVFGRHVHGHPLAYLDSANTSQKPRAVVDAMSDHLLLHNANVARAMHQLGAEASAAFEEGRAKVAAFIGARTEEVVFTKNASEALNLAAYTLADHLKLGPGDEVVVSVMEHHSNIVPWQLACERTGATLRWFDITDDGRLDLAAADEAGLINERTKVVSLTWVSNVLGTINPVAQLAEKAHAVGALHAHLHGGGLLPGADHLPVEGRAVAAAQAAQVNGLEQVGFARAVFAHKHRYPRWGREQHLMIAAKIVQPQRLDKHYL